MQKTGDRLRQAQQPSEIFFKDPRLPWLECRRSTGSAREFKPHLHRSFSIGAVERGRVECTIGTSRSRLGPGKLVFINPEQVHCCNTVGEHTRNFTMLYLQSDWCRLVQQSLWEIDTFVPASYPVLDESACFQRFCRTMEDVIDSGTTIMEKEELLGELMVDLFPRVCAPQPLRACPADDIGAIKRLLASSLQDNLSLAMLADRFRTNPYTLLRRFKAETGITPHAYRTNCRVEQAKSLLQQGLDIAETALECGFFDQSHLHRHFKAFTTVTPREYQINFVQ